MLLPLLLSPLLPLLPLAAAGSESAIPRGGQVLHTYGDQADAELLQTFGFVDSLDGFVGA